MRAILQSQLGKLDLVNREEFDVQTQVLLRTREKLSQMEKRLAELEARRRKKAASNDNRRYAVRISCIISRLL